MKSITVFIFIVLLGCSSRKSEESYKTNFIKWIDSNRYSFDEYLVLEFNACHYCHGQVVKFIQNDYLEKVANKAFVLIINSKSELYPIQDHLNNPNLLVYNLQKEQQGILDNGPRLYSQSDEGVFEYKLLNAETLTQKIEQMVYNITTYTRISVETEKIMGIPIPGNENFIAYSDSSHLIYYVENFEIYNEVQD